MWNGGFPTLETQERGGQDRPPPRSLRGRNDRIEKVGDRGQIFSILTHSCSIRRNRGNMDRFYRFRSRSISAAQAPRRLSENLSPKLLKIRASDRKNPPTRKTTTRVSCFRSTCSTSCRRIECFLYHLFEQLEVEAQYSDRGPLRAASDRVDPDLRLQVQLPDRAALGGSGVHVHRGELPELPGVERFPEGPRGILPVLLQADGQLAMGWGW